MLASAVAALGVRLSGDPTAHFPRGSPSVAAWLELSLRFDAFNTLIVGLEEPSAPLTAEGLKRVKRITDRLAALKANGVLAVASVTNVEAIHEGADGSLETEPLVLAIPEDQRGLAELAKRISADGQVSGALISRDQRGYLLVLRADPRRDAAELVGAIRAVVEEDRGPLISTYFGAPFFQAVIGRALRAALWWLVPSLLVLLFAVLALTVRSARVVLSVFAAAAACLLVWLGLVRVSGLALTPPALTAALLLFVLAALVLARCLEAGPRSVLPGLAAVGLGSLALLALDQLASFAAAMVLGTVAIGLVTRLLFVPLAGPTAGSPAPGQRLPPSLAAALAAVVLLGAGALALQLRLHGTPQTVFSDTDEVGRAISFFDRRFGGSDFVQVDFHGDLREPELAARLLRLTELLGDSSTFPDVRAVAPVLGLLNHGFGGVHRIPTSRESLNNLWFFLEGRPDVRNLVSDQRDEAMVLLRVPSKLARPAAELAAIVEAAVAGSLEMGRASTKARLAALGRVHGLSVAQVDAVLDAPAADPQPEVHAALRKWLGSGESPYQPTDEQWLQLAAALQAEPERRTARLTAVTSTFTELGDPAHAARLVESVLAREKELRLAYRAMRLVDRLWAAAPDAARIRAQGIFADALEPHSGAGAAAKISVTGLPIVAAQLERDSVGNLWRALGLLLGLGAIARLLLTRDARATARALLEATLSSALAFAAGALWLGADPGSATVFLLPALATSVTSAREGRVSAGFLLALAVSGVPLVFTGALPVMRIGVGLVAGLGAVALVQLASRRVASALSRGP